MNNKIKIIYEQAFVEYFDITIIMKTTYVGNDIKSTISGFYYGHPTKDDMEKFLEKN